MPAATRRQVRGDSYRHVYGSKTSGDQEPDSRTPRIVTGAFPISRSSAVCRQRWTVRLGEVEPVFGQTGRVLLDITARTAHDGALKWTRPSTPRAARSISLRLAGDSTIDTGMEWAWNVEVRATPRFPLAGVASCAGGRGGCTVTHAAAGSRGRGTCVGCPGTKGKVCWLRRPATVGSTRPGHRAAAPWVSTSRHFTRRGGQPPVRGRASAR